MGVVVAAPKARGEGGRGVEPVEPAPDPTARGPPREVRPVGMAGPPQVLKAESGGETSKVRQAPGMAGGGDPTLPVQGHVFHYVKSPPMTVTSPCASRAGDLPEEVGPAVRTVGRVQGGELDPAAPGRAPGPTRRRPATSRAVSAAWNSADRRNRTATPQDRPVPECQYRAGRAGLPRTPPPTGARSRGWSGSPCRRATGQRLSAR